MFAGDLLYVDDGEVKRSPWFDAEMGAMTMEKIASQSWNFEFTLPRRARGLPLAKHGDSVVRS